MSWTLAYTYCWVSLVRSGLGCVIGMSFMVWRQGRKRQTSLSVEPSRTEPSSGPTSFYGLGWFVTNDRGRTVVMHGGDFSTGYNTQAVMLPGSGLGIVVLCSWCSAWPTGSPTAHPSCPIPSGGSSTKWSSAPS